jgi:hypothetical protein
MLSFYLYRVSQNYTFSRNLFELTYAVAEKNNLDNSSSQLSSEIAPIISWRGLCLSWPQGVVVFFSSCMQLPG